MPKMLLLETISCLRGDRLLFEGVSLRLGPGDAAVVSGPNGAGKSSLLRIAAGLLRPSAGRVERRARIAIEGELAALDPDLPLAAALAFWARLDGGDPGAVSRALDALGLSGLGPVPVRLLSTGQRRRAGLARIAAGGAPVWLLDEPANGLDRAALASLDALLADHRAAGGCVLAATHVPLGLAGAREIEL